MQGFTLNGRVVLRARLSLVFLQAVPALVTFRPLPSLPQTGSYKVLLLLPKLTSVVMFARIVGPGSMLSKHLSLAPAPQALLPQVPTHALRTNITQMVAPLAPRVLHAHLAQRHQQLPPLQLHVSLPELMQALLTQASLLMRRSRAAQRHLPILLAGMDASP